MKIKVDFDECEANGVCEGLAPAIFQLDDDDYLQLLDDQVTDENRALVQRAILSCPKSAISIVEG